MINHYMTDREAAILESFEHLNDLTRRIKHELEMERNEHNSIRDKWRRLTDELKKKGIGELDRWNNFNFKEVEHPQSVVGDKI